MIQGTISAPVLAAIGAAVALAAGGRTPTSVTGAITGPGTTALPPGAIVRVWLESESGRHQPARRVAEATFPVAGKTFPIPYTLSYPAADIEPGTRYQLRAVISADNRVLFLARQGVPAALEGAPPRLDVPVEPFAPAGVRPRVTVLSPRSGLSGGEWRLVALPGAKARLAAAADAPTLVFDGAAKRISGSTGCNQFFGTWASGDANALSLDPAGMTMRACPDDVSAVESAFLGALRAARAYRTTGTTLELLSGDRVLARFERQKPGPPSD